MVESYLESLSMVALLVASRHSDSESLSTSTNTRTSSRMPSIRSQKSCIHPASYEYRSDSQETLAETLATRATRDSRETRATTLSSYGSRYSFVALQRYTSTRTLLYRREYQKATTIYALHVLALESIPYGVSSIELVQLWGYELATIASDLARETVATSRYHTSYAQVPLWSSHLE
eukprot:scaffold588158_cov19-Prasinocladus_malaysianus.AAC.1